MRFIPLNCDFFTPDTKKMPKMGAIFKFMGEKTQILKYGRNNAFEVLKLTM